MIRLIALEVDWNTTNLITAVNNTSRNADRTRQAPSARTRQRKALAGLRHFEGTMWSVMSKIGLIPKENSKPSEPGHLLQLLRHPRAPRRDPLG